MPDQLTQQERLIARRSVAVQKAILRWMDKRAREEATRQVRGLVRRGDKWVSVAKHREPVVKAKDPIDEELVEILLRFGIAQARDASMRIGSHSNISMLIDPRRLERELSSKEFRLKVFTELEGWATKRAERISADTKRMVKESIMRLLEDSSTEEPLPSVGEMARRIRTQVHGTDRDGKRIYAWSPERAMVIARTEIAQAENTGTFAGYEAAGVTRIRWLAKTDGRSGDRHHELLNTKEIAIGDTFTTPLGNELRYPGDPMGEAEDTINCRCAFRAVIVPDERRRG